MKNNFSRKVLIALALMLCCTMVKAQQTAHVIIFDKMNYLLQLPEGYNAEDSITKWPMMIFLHGAGETGDDAEKIKWLGPPRKIADGHKYPFIVVSPQSPERGWRPDFVYRLSEFLRQNYAVDSDRIYLTGLSMGGFGTWNTAQHHPHYFAAIIPICGGLHDTSNVVSFENLPVWCFHGAKDDDVNISYSQNSMDALKPFKNTEHKFTIYPDAGHDSWTETYDNPKVYEWMLSKTRYKYKEVPVSQDILHQYAGKYVNQRQDTLSVKAVDNALEVNFYQYENEIFKAASDNKFFAKPEEYNHIRFERDENSKVSEITFYFGTYPMRLKRIE